MVKKELLLEHLISACGCYVGNKGLDDVLGHYYMGKIQAFIYCLDNEEVADFYDLDPNHFSIYFGTGSNIESLKNLKKLMRTSLI